MTTDGGGWTLLAKVDGGAGEGWRWNSDAWTTGTAFGGACILSPAAGCDAKSAAWGSLVVAQIQVHTGSAMALYNMVNPALTMLQRYTSGLDFTLPNNGVVIGNRYGGTNDTAYAVIGMGDGDGEAPTTSSSDRCMFHVRPSNSQTATTGFCAGRVRGTTQNSFVSFSTSVGTNARADYARMNNGSSPTLAGPMLIWGR